MNKYIDVDEVVANAATMVPDVSDELALMMRQWVWMAMRDIGPNYNDVTTTEIEITGGSAAKPVDMIGNFIDLGVYSAEGYEIPYKYNFDGSSIHQDDVIKTRIDIYEDEGFVHFSDFPVTPDFIKVKYYRMPLDDCGLPKVPESHLNAVSAYLMYRYHVRDAKNYAMIGMTRDEWQNERAKVRGRNKSVAGIRAKQIEKEWLTHIPKMNRKRF